MSPRPPPVAVPLRVLVLWGLLRGPVGFLAAVLSGKDLWVVGGVALGRVGFEAERETIFAGGWAATGVGAGANGEGVELDLGDRPGSGAGSGVETGRAFSADGEAPAWIEEGARLGCSGAAATRFTWIGSLPIGNGTGGLERRKAKRASE